MASVEKMISYAISKWHKVGYSMGPKRLGPDFLDCSSFVYYALIAGGFLAKNHPIGNTETLFKLNGTVLEEVYDYKNVRRGDIFIRGYEGYSSGAYGHTGIFLEKDKIIHCNASNNTVTINGCDSYISSFLRRKRSANERYFRPVIRGINFSKAFKVKDEKWRGICQADCNVRAKPSTSSQIVALYKKGDVIYYDEVWEGGGYRWISYIGYSGKRRFVAYRDMNFNSWISFK